MDEADSKEPIATPLKIQILLAEYTSVRNHIIARTPAAIQAAAIGFASLALIVPEIERHVIAGSLLLCMALVVVAGIALFIYRDLMSETAHIRRLEIRINEIAEETLLTWDSEHGISKGLWSRLRSPR